MGKLTRKIQIIIILLILVLSVYTASKYARFDNFSLQGNNVFYNYDPNEDALEYITTIEKRYIFGSALFIYNGKQYLGSLEGLEGDKYFEVNFIVMDVNNNFKENKINILIENNIEDPIIAYSLSLFYDDENNPLFTTIIERGFIGQYKFQSIQFDFNGEITKSIDLKSVDNPYFSIKDNVQLNKTTYVYLVSFEKEYATEFIGNYLLFYNILTNKNISYPLEKYVRSITLTPEMIIYSTSLDEYNLQERSLTGNLLSSFIINLDQITVNLGFDENLLIISYKQVIEIDLINRIIELTVTTILIVIFIYYRNKK